MILGQEHKARWRFQHDGCTKTLMFLLQTGFTVKMNESQLLFYFKKAETPSPTTSVSYFDFYCKLSAPMEIQEDTVSFMVQFDNLGDCPSFLFEKVDKGTFFKFIVQAKQAVQYYYKPYFYFCCRNIYTLPEGQWGSWWNPGERKSAFRFSFRRRFKGGCALWSYRDSSSSRPVLSQAYKILLRKEYVASPFLNIFPLP